MSNFYVKIDEDLESFLSAKENAERFVNDCIRRDKIESEKQQQIERERIKKELADFKKNGENQPTESPEKKSSFKVISLMYCLIFIAIIMVLLSLSQIKKESHPSDTPINVSDDSTAILPDPSAVKSKSVSNIRSWNFKEEQDKMTSTKNIWASIVSDNSVNLDAPYYSTEAKITIRYMKKWGYDAIIYVSEGQVYGNEYSNQNYVMVRFDDDKPIRYWFDEPADGSSTHVFIRKHNDFISRCKKAKRIKVEIPLYEAGRPIFEFSVDKPLVWKK